MNYSDVIKELESRGSDRKEPALEATRQALDALRKPEEDYSVVLVGGTNGKGSTVEMVSEGLQESRHDVGVYKSPHLCDARERIQVNSDKISEEEFLRLYQKIEELEIEKELTFFEFMTVLAFLYFSEQHVDYAVMEVGMGGRLDATNAAEPEISAITNVDEDHTEYLGETREEIAREKAGIIPENGKVVAGDMLESILETASDRNAEVLEPHDIKEFGDSYVFREQTFSLPVKGSFQADNLGVALRLLDELESLPDNFEEAFSDLSIPGRMEVIDRMPTYIHDGAHNPAALREILPDLPDDFICVFSALESKNIDEMLSVLGEKASKFYLTRSEFSLAEHPEKIAGKIDTPYKVEADPEKAVELALEEAGRDGTVVVTGSLYLIGDIKEKRGE